MGCGIKFEKSQLSGMPENSNKILLPASTVQLPTVEFLAELKHFVISVAPNFNKADKLVKERPGDRLQRHIRRKSQLPSKTSSLDAESINHPANKVILTKKTLHQNIINIIGVSQSPRNVDCDGAWS
eukprot:TRINITY_DN6948_c0_g1_i6.p1 TRINITY_DN6948_c0_g1~~TRINITY_DN6948_c0_g1_i6.p1  ORF type:complete len:127 (+),score=22.06 TRINITY_DN6948_c0_g1_i6:59-439(+)